jgi:beta-glucosidase
VFATQWAGEAFDVSLALADGQDALIQSVAAANPHTVVVLESGGAVLTPWRNDVAGILAAWFPGTAGGTAIADVLFGRTNPSGHLPISFPAELAQLPRPAVPTPGDVRYTEGAAVGYKWLDRQALHPAFAFGHGLSYTSFEYGNLRVAKDGAGLRASFTVRNTGKVAGKAVPQIYVAGEGWEAPKRLGGFAAVMLAPSATTTVTVTIDPRLLANFDETNRSWRIAKGVYRVMLGGASDALGQPVTVKLDARSLPAAWHPLESAAAR